MTSSTSGTLPKSLRRRERLGGGLTGGHAALDFGVEMERELVFEILFLALPIDRARRILIRLALGDRARIHLD